MSRAVKAAKGLIVQQKEQVRDIPNANNSITKAHLVDELKFKSKTGSANLTIPSGHTEFFPYGTIATGATYTVAQNAVLIGVNSLLVDGDLIIENDGIVQII